MNVGAFLAGLALILVVARVFGSLARRAGQPAVVGEILAGILLGPTLLGDGAAAVFPAEVRPALGALSSVGLALFMFGVGLEFDRARLRPKAPLVVWVSLGSIAVPFVLGVLLALILLARHAPGNQLGFVLFVGMAMAITAFPVLARMLDDQGMSGTTIGGVALASAAVCDVAVWLLLAVVIAVVDGQGQHWWQVLFLLPYLMVMVTVVPTLLRRLLARHSKAVLTVVFGGVLASGAATEWMGLHFVFGAFLFGTVLRAADDEGVWTTVVQNMRQVNAALFLPVFFVVAGMGVDLSWVGWQGAAELGAITLVATAGKFAGVFTAARLGGMESRPAGVLAVLMNTRGLTELVLLVIGLRLGLMGAGLYSLMVVMALLTTAMTVPLLRLAPLRARTLS